MEKNLITAGKLKELGLQVFGQKFDVNSDKSYTSVLTPDEECLVVDEILEGRNASGWFSFLSRYQKHYPLSSKALDLLLEKIGDNEKARELIANEIKHYGYNEKQGLAVCKHAETLGVEFLLLLCENARVSYATVHDCLAMISLRDYPELCEKHGFDPKSDLGDVYQNKIRARRK